MKRLLRSDYALVIGLLIVITVIALPTLTYPLGRDQGEFATVARGILNGRIPYKELWNPKPPAIFYVYALAIKLFGQTTTAIRAIDFFIVPAVSVCLYWLGKHIANRRVGLWSALIFPVFYFTETFWTLTQNDGIVLLPMTLTVVGVVKAARWEEQGARQRAIGFSREHWWVFLAGALSAYAVWFKYPFAIFGVGAAVGYALLARSGTAHALGERQAGLRPTPTRTLVNLAFFTLGGLVIGVGGILFMQAIGAWDELFLSAQVTSQYTALTFNFTDFADLMRTAVGFRWQQWGLAWVLAGVWFLIGRWGERRGAGWRVILIWLAAGLAIMLVQAKAYDYHWLPMLPPLALLGADTVDRVIGWVGRTRSIMSLQVGVAVVFLGIMIAGIWPKVWPYLSGQEDQTAYYGHFVAGAADEFAASDSLKVANFLREREVPGDSLYIWGFRPEVYYVSGLNPATRFIFQFPLVASWYPAQWKQDNVDTLWAALPPYVLVLQVDYMPWVTGSHEDSNTLLQGYTELNNWLIFNYERETQIGNFFIWKRKR